MKVSRGVWLMLLASLSFGLMNVSVKFVHHMPVSEVVFFRAIVQIFLSLIVLFQLKQSPWGKNPRLLAMRGLFGSIGLFCYFYTLQVMPLGNAIVIHYLSPILTTLVAVALGDEKNHPLSYLFFAICLMGVVVVNGVSQEVTLAGVIAGLGGALFSAFAYNTIRRLKNLENPNVVVFYFPLITLPLSLLVGGLYDDAWRWPLGVEWLWLLMTGVTTQLGQFFMTRAYQSDKASNVSAISYAGIIWGAGFGVLLFEEQYQWLQFVGMGMVLLGMLLNVRINLRREAAQ